MRRRITLIQKPETPFTPDQATLTRDALSIRYLDAFREERVTLSFDELTPDVFPYSLSYINKYGDRF